MFYEYTIRFRSSSSRCANPGFAPAADLYFLSKVLAKTPQQGIPYIDTTFSPAYPNILLTPFLNPLATSSLTSAHHSHTHLACRYLFPSIQSL